MKRWIWIACIFMGIFTHEVVGQDEEAQNGILLTGMVLDADTRSPMPYVNVRILNTVYGSASDANGYFSLFISPGDTLLFTSIGYSDAQFIMPADVTRNNYSLIQLMRQKVILLSEVVVFPWPSIDQFKEAFLDVEPERNMDDLVREVQFQTLQDSRENQLSEYEADQRRYQRLYEMHQIFPPNNFLNPMRWNQFIRGVTTAEDKEEED